MSEIVPPTDQHDAEPPPSAGSRRPWMLAAIVGLAGAAVYINALANPFHFDDISIILNDPRVQQFDLWGILTGNYWYLPNTDRLYRPLVLLSYAINWAVLPEAWAFRLINVALHAANALLVFALVRRTFRSAAAACVAGLVFAVHALNSEPLNTIVGRADLLTTFFMLTALVLYWDDAEDKPRKRLLRPILAALCFGAALLCKENAITLPGLVLLFDWFHRGQPDAKQATAFWWRRLLRSYVPLVLAAGAYLVLRHQTLGSLTTGGEVIDYFENYIAHPTHNIDPAQGESPAAVRWGTPLATFAHAVRLTLLPNALCFDYSYAGFEPVRTWGDGRMWLGAAMLAAAIGAFVVSARRRREVALGIGFWFIGYSIVSNVVVVIGTIFAERVFYLPTVGYCMLLGLAGRFAFRTVTSERELLRLLKPVVAIGLVLLLGAYAWLTVDRNRDWRSQKALYASAFEVNPRSCKTLSGLAADALREGRYADALKYCQAVFDEKDGVAPEYWPVYRTAAMTLRLMAANVEPRKADFYRRQALAYFLRALQLGAAGDPNAMLGAAELMVQLEGNYKEAIRLATTLAEYRPTQARAHDRAARWLLTAEPPGLRDPERGLRHARAAVGLRPEVGNYAATLADALIATGKLDEARQVIEGVLETLPPDSPGVAEMNKRLERIRANSAAPNGGG